MKSRIFVAFAPFVVISAALLGVNWRLNHPPLSKADKEFRALVAGADGAEIIQVCPGGPCGPDVVLTKPPLNATQTRELIGTLRLIEGSLDLIPQGAHQVRLELRFLRGNRLLSQISCWQNRSGSQLSSFSFAARIYKLNPRFERPFGRYLNQVVPQRVRP